MKLYLKIRSSVRLWAMSMASHMTPDKAVDGEEAVDVHVDAGFRLGALAVGRYSEAHY